MKRDASVIINAAEVAAEATITTYSRLSLGIVTDMPGGGGMGWLSGTLVSTSLKSEVIQ